MMEYSEYSPKKKRIVIAVVSVIGVLAQVGVALLALGISGNIKF